MSSILKDWNPVRPLLLLNMRRDLLWQFTKRNIQSGFRGSLLGVFWVVLSPLLMLALYTFVFGVVFGGSFEQLNAEGHLVRKDGASYALGIFLGLSVMSLISGTLSSSATLIVSNPNFVKKVVFPLEVLPVAQVGNLAFNFSISLGLCLIGAILVGDGFCMAWIWLPLIILPIVFISLGIGWLLASLGVFFRDIAQLTQFLGMVLLYASGVFYSAGKYQKAIGTFLKLNPVLHIVDQLRQAILWQEIPDRDILIMLWVSSLVVFQLGYWIFQRLRSDFADVL